jgi:hypothetical protein
MASRSSSSNGVKLTSFLIVILVLSFSSLIYGFDSSSSSSSASGSSPGSDSLSGSGSGTVEDYCSSLLNCTFCSAAINNTCFWCATNLNNRTEGYCTSLINVTSEEIASCPLWCTGPESECDPCSKGFWPCSETITGQLVLVVFYGLLLAYGANMIADGSELLLEVRKPFFLAFLRLIPFLRFLLFVIIHSHSICSRSHSH